MDSQPISADVVSFGEFEANLRSREVHRNGVRVRLPDQSFQVLAMLVERRGELITREEIRQRLWSGDTFVDFDHGLNNAVNRLREALGDSAESPRFVETLPRRGYRFIAPIEESAPILTQADNAPALIGDLHKKQHWRIVLAISGVLFVATLTITGMHGDKKAAAGRITSLAVLPLANVSGDPAQEYFADGMTDTLITDLAEIGSVRVISRTSAMHYKETRESLPQIARELDVDAVIEGTVSRAGDRVRINAQLIDARNEGHIWAKAYERNIQDVLQLQNELASSITMEVSGKLRLKDTGSAAPNIRHVNPQAWDDYLKGEYFLNKWTLEGFGKAKTYFDEAIELAPGFADAHAGLGEYYETMAFMNLTPGKEAWLKAEDQLGQAMDLDKNSSKAHALLGMLKLQFRCDRSGAERELNRALDLNPANVEALDAHSYYLLEIGRSDQAIAEKRTVVDHDPLSVRTNAELGLYFFNAGHINDAIAQLRKTLELDPNYAAAHMRLGLAYGQMQRYSDAIGEFKKAIALDNKPARLVHLGDTYAQWGKENEARAVIGELQEMSKQSHVSPTGIALIYARLGDKKRAISMLEKAKAEDEPKITDSGFDGLRSDPRFKTQEARLKPDPSCPAF